MEKYKETHKERDAIREKKNKEAWERALDLEYMNLYLDLLQDE